MDRREKSIENINQKIDVGQAKVLTAEELLERSHGGAGIGADDLDVVTLAFSSSLAGCAVMVVVPVAGRGDFTRAESISLNGVEGFPGPAPNERMGIVDTLIFSEKERKDHDPEYRGADLIYDLLRGNSIEVECLTEEGGFYTNSFRLPDIQFARMYTYNSRLPTTAADPRTEGNAVATPWDVLRAGYKVLLNRAEAVIIGSGIRSKPEALSLSLAADLFSMDVEMLSPPQEGGDGLGHNTIAIPIPVVNDQTAEAVTRYVIEQASIARQSKQYDRERILGDFLQQEILGKRFRLTDSELIMGKGGIG